VMRWEVMVPLPGPSSTILRRVGMPMACHARTHLGKEEEEEEEEKEEEGRVGECK
jgi:hypothetical protein